MGYFSVWADTKIIPDSFGLFLRDVDQLVSCSAGYFEKKVSPRETVLRRSLIFETHTKGLFGSYVETNKAETKKYAIITNKNHWRTFLGILLGLTKNNQGTQNVFDIKTIAIKKCRTIRNIPLLQAVIKSVNDWEKISVREEHQNKIVLFVQNKERYYWDNNYID